MTKKAEDRARLLFEITGLGPEEFANRPDEFLVENGSVEKLSYLIAEDIVAAILEGEHLSNIVDDLTGALGTMFLMGRLAKPGKH